MDAKDKLVYTTDLCGKIAQQIAAANGDVELVLCKIFAANCGYENARAYSVTVAQCFGMSDVEFMRSWRKLRFVAAQRLKAASKDAETAAQTSGDSGSI